MKNSVIFFLFNILILCLYGQDSLYFYTEFHGENDQDKFGVVANIGDVNGDGYEDLMVGAPAYIPYTVSDGYAKLYLGGIDFDTTADIKFQVFDEQIISFGGTIAGNGDLNGDGFSDFAIADPHYGDFDVGKVYIYFGGSELDTVPELILTLNPGQYFYTQFGFSMSMNGDINGDGYDDLVVGAPFDDWDRHGEVFIYFGGANMDNVPDINLVNSVQYLRFGYSLDYTIDANNDSINDLLVGSWPFNNTVNDKRVYIFWGSNTNNISFQNSHVFIDTSQIITLPIEGIGLGDIDGNGFSDFALLERDSAVVYFSPINENNFNKITFQKPSSYDYLYNISTCFDTNNDNKDDILICAGYNINFHADILALNYLDTNSFLYTNLISYNGERGGFAKYLGVFTKLLSDTISSIAIGHLEALFYEHHGNGKVYIYNNDYLLGINDPENSNDLKDFKLFQNYPNPFNASTKIEYRIQELSDVELTVYDLLGKEVTTLFSGTKLAGIYSIKINFNNFSYVTGIYFLRLKALPHSNPKNVVLKTIKIILLK